MLNVAVVLRDSETPSAGECRLLDALSQDGRFAVTLLTAGKPLVFKLPIAISTLLKFERAGLDFTGKTPTFRCDVTSVQPLDKFATLNPAPDVIVDFSGLKSVEVYADTVPFGMWRLDTYSHGAGLDAAFQGKGTTLVNLLRYRGKERLVETIAHAEYDTKTLALMSIMYIQEKSVQLVERELARLTLGAGQVTGAPVTAPPMIPGTLDLGRHLCRITVDIAGRVWRSVKGKMGLRPRMFTLRVGRGAAPDFDLASSIEIVLW